MREIKFRGKINKESDFIYGSLLVIGEETYIYPHDYGDLDDIDFGYAFEKVLPETVGQFTGLHDKNGKEIYAGDIVNAFYGTGSRGVVEFSSGMFVYRWGNGFGTSIYVSKETEITGNIYDDPDLRP